jgi:ABC-2 type transport system ATP-binding protein
MDKHSFDDAGCDLLTVCGVSAGYNGQRVVDDINLTLRCGDILGLLGANGSGKSTLLKAVTGQIRLMTGTVLIGGIDLMQMPEHAKAEFGLAIDVPDLPTALSGRQYLELVASIRACAANDWPCGDVPARLDLTPVLDHPISKYSYGMRAKISIAAALLGAPPLIIFDESLNGLDPVAAWEVKRIILELAATRRHGFIVSTHVVETVPVLCNQAIFLAKGRVVERWDAQGLAETSREPGAFEASVMQALKTRKGIGYAGDVMAGA